MKPITILLFSLFAFCEIKAQLSNEKITMAFDVEETGNNSRLKKYRIYDSGKCIILTYYKKNGTIERPYLIDTIDFSDSKKYRVTYKWYSNKYLKSDFKTFNSEMEVAEFKSWDYDRNGNLEAWYIGKNEFDSEGRISKSQYDSLSSFENIRHTDIYSYYVDSVVILNEKNQKTIEYTDSSYFYAMHTKKLNFNKFKSIQTSCLYYKNGNLRSLWANTELGYSSTGRKQNTYYYSHSNHIQCDENGFIISKKTIEDEIPDQPRIDNWKVTILHSELGKTNEQLIQYLSSEINANLSYFPKRSLFPLHFNGLRKNGDIISSQPIYDTVEIPNHNMFIGIKYEIKKDSIIDNDEHGHFSYSVIYRNGKEAFLLPKTEYLNILTADEAIDDSYENSNESEVWGVKTNWINQDFTVAKTMENKYDIFDKKGNKLNKNPIIFFKAFLFNKKTYLLAIINNFSMSGNTPFDNEDNIEYYIVTENGDISENIFMTQKEIYGLNIIGVKENKNKIYYFSDNYPIKNSELNKPGFKEIKVCPEKTLLLKNLDNQITLFDAQTNKTLIPFGKFDDLTPVSNHTKKYAIFKNGTNFYDKNGKQILANFENITFEKDNIYKAYRTSKDSIVYIYKFENKKMNFIKTMTQPTNWNYKYIRYKKDGNYGLCDMNYNDLIPPIYNQLFKYGKHFIGYRNTHSNLDYFDSTFKKIKTIESVIYTRKINNYYTSVFSFFKKGDYYEYIDSDGNLTDKKIKQTYSLSYINYSDFNIVKLSDGNTEIRSFGKPVMFRGECDSVVSLHSLLKITDISDHTINGIVILKDQQAALLNENEPNDNPVFYDKIELIDNKLFGHINMKKYILNGKIHTEYVAEEIFNFKESNIIYRENDLVRIGDKWIIKNENFESQLEFNGFIPVQQFNYDQNIFAIENFIFCVDCQFQWGKNKSKNDQNKKIIVRPDYYDPNTWYDSIDKNDQLVYEKTTGFEFELKGGKYGLSDAKGNIIIPAIYDEFILLKKSNIDMLFEMPFSKTEKISETYYKNDLMKYEFDYIIAGNQNKYKLFDINGKEIINSFDQYKIDSLQGAKFFKVHNSGAETLYNWALNPMPFNDLNKTIMFRNFAIINTSSKAKKESKIYTIDSTEYYANYWFKGKAKLNIYSFIQNQWILTDADNIELLAKDTNKNFHYYSIKKYAEGILQNSTNNSNIIFYKNKKKYILETEDPDGATYKNPREINME
jgi:hypothetical protein